MIKIILIINTKVSIKLMSGGRPKNKDEDFCPKCGELGNPYQKDTTKNSSNDHYFNTWFRHVDRKRKDCYIENKLRSS